MTKDRSFTKDGLPIHHVRRGAPCLVRFVDDEELPRILHAHFESMRLSRQGGLTREKVDNLKRLYCEEIERAFQTYKYKCE